MPLVACPLPELTEAEHQKITAYATILASDPPRRAAPGDVAGKTLPQLRAMLAARFLPTTGRKAELIDRLAAGPTNDLSDLANRNVSETFSLGDYQRHFDALPESLRRAVEARWGAAQDDPFIQGGEFALPCYRFENVTISKWRFR